MPLPELDATSTRHREDGVRVDDETAALPFEPGSSDLRRGRMLSDSEPDARPRESRLFGERRCAADGHHLRLLRPVQPGLKAPVDTVLPPLRVDRLRVDAQVPGELATGRPVSTKSITLWRNSGGCPPLSVLCSRAQAVRELCSPTPPNRGRPLPRDPGAEHRAAFASFRPTQARHEPQAWL